MNIIESPYVTEQFRFPRSRKKRIRNKWAARPENHRPMTKAAYMMGDALVCHPIFAARLHQSPSNTKAELGT